MLARDVAMPRKRKPKDHQVAKVLMRCYERTRRGLEIIADRRGRQIPRELDLIVRKELQTLGVNPDTFGPLFGPRAAAGSTDATPQAQEPAAVVVDDDALPPPDAPKTGLGMIP
jgi:hypothetical protein